MSQDSQPGRLLGPYSCLSTLLQLFLIGTGIEKSRRLFVQKDQLHRKLWKNKGFCAKPPAGSAFVRWDLRNTALSPTG
jgi:hypothetical protein